jgi:hypothetical protein
VVSLFEIKWNSKTLLAAYSRWKSSDRRVPMFVVGNLAVAIVTGVLVVEAMTRGRFTYR